MSDFKDMTNELIKESMDMRSKSIDAYIRSYLLSTGSKIEDLVLCEQRIFEDNIHTTKYFLEQKTKENVIIDNFNNKRNEIYGKFE